MWRIALVKFCRIGAGSGSPGESQPYADPPPLGLYLFAPRFLDFLAVNQVVESSFGNTVVAGAEAAAAVTGIGNPAPPSGL